MKKYLLIAGYNYYPGHGTSDWVKTFETREDAKAYVEVKIQEYLFLKGPRKGQVKSSHKTFVVDGNKFDWYEIVNLDNWIN